MRHVAMEVAPHVNMNATAQSYVENPTCSPKVYQQTEAFRQRLAECPAGRLATGKEWVLSPFAPGWLAG
jgi:hypothetical protein